MSASQKSATERELKFYDVSVKVLSALIIIYFVITILANQFYDVSLISNHSDLVSGILGGFIGIGLFIQIRRYLLYRRIGKGKEFLMGRSFMMLLVVFLIIIYALFL